MNRDRIHVSGLLLHLWLRLRLSFVVLPLLLQMNASNALAATSLPDEEASDGMIEVQYLPDLLEPYRERRSSVSYQFAIGMENFAPNDFISLNDGLTYDELFGESSLQMAQGSLGLKYNFFLGALTLDVSGGMGNVSSSKSGVYRQLEMMKKQVSFGWTLDAILREPYIAPYVQGHILEIDFQDKGAITGDSSGTTSMTSGYTVGLLIQLNSIDPTDTALVANRDFGLNNTFLDLFASQYNPSEATDDPDFATTLNWGAGLKLEF